MVTRRAHGCLGELADTANQRMTVAHDNARRLVNRIERHPERYPDASQPVGATYARILHANVCLLLASHAKQSATISSVNMAQLFLQVSFSLARTPAFYTWLCGELHGTSMCVGF